TALSPRPDAAPEARQFVASLSELNLSAGSITPAQAARWKQTLQKLVQQGAGAAVPAIRDFLAKNVDLDFDPAKGGALLGYATLRLALFDALRQIGGPATGAAAQVLQTTADPRE